MLQHKQVAEKIPEDETNDILVKNSIYLPFSTVVPQRYEQQMLVKEFRERVQKQLKLRAARVWLDRARWPWITCCHVWEWRFCRAFYMMNKEGNEGEQSELSQETTASVEPFGALCGSYDVLVDASNNVSTCSPVHDACSRLSTPLVSGSAVILEDTSPDTLATQSRVEEDARILGCLQAVDRVKLITSVGKPLVGVKCIYDAYDSQFRRSKDSLQLECSDTYLLLDTRVRIHFKIVHFPEAVNVPTLELMEQDPATNQYLDSFDSQRRSRTASST
ncbi:hypothetical protein PsorP6_012669 [Peronosclerospora sorghi]|uniref:Uncharacterized protein n=1 Tax=Peronosclerospora sorghi TaxID=230839 RepID=A0ACC0WGH8_9STRA|nr:hypothetical protein PsorP6_012669 [Peronosclerospora sorghi]